MLSEFTPQTQIILTVVCVLLSSVAKIAGGRFKPRCKSLKNRYYTVSYLLSEGLVPVEDPVSSNIVILPMTHFSTDLIFLESTTLLPNLQKTFIH